MIPTPWRRPEAPDPAELARLLPAPGDPVMPRDRHHQLEEFLMKQIQQQTVPAPAPAAPRRRVLLIGVPVTALAVAAGITFALTGTGSDSPGKPASVAAPVVAAPVAAPVVQLEPGSTVQLASTTKRIADATARRATPQPSQDQYVYVKTKVSHLSTKVSTDTNASRTWVEPLHTREVWMSPDGLKGWLDEPGYQPEGGITLDRDEPGDSYYKVKALPTDPDTLLKRIYARTNSESDRDQQAFTLIGDVLREQLVPARTAAALYQAAAKIPGVVVVEHSQDAAGRDGVALARLDARTGVRTEWIFDRHTYTYLGSRGVQVNAVDNVKPGTVVDRTAVLERAVVDHKKQRPTSPDAA
ncbi:CU044_5270 family protein [Streptomyces sp. NPDC047985]|uniref:CU044_5270 family protein n=1 Tax=Streptomyces sp. NPDC047985 TaxID=3155384 RepID=UPI00341AD739